MGKFNKKLSAEFNPPRKWILERALTYRNEDIAQYKEVLAVIKVPTPGNKITVKKGFKTDLASVPRICWNIISPWDVARAAIIHDLLYKRIRQYRWDRLHRFDNVIENPNIIKDVRKAADEVFLMAMIDAAPSIPKWKIYSAYYSVRSFGKFAIRPRKDNI